MSRIRGKNTAPERALEGLLRAAGHEFETHARDLPGRPDVVFRRAYLAVFVDGDFWHGWRFPLWRHKLSPRWRTKIAENIARDRRNFARLRRGRWRVVRVWEHQIVQHPERVISRIEDALLGAPRSI